MQFINLPIPRPKSFYTACQKRFVTLATASPDVRAVYNGGTVRHPGISDIDFILCLKNHLSRPLRIEEQLDPELKQLISGGSILKVNEANMRDIKIIDDFPMTRLAGQRYDFSEYKSSWLYLCRALDWLPERLFRLVQTAAAPQVDVMRTLQLLKSTTVSLEITGKMTNTKHHQPFTKRVATLRAHWFKNVPASAKKIPTVLTEAIVEAQRALNNLDGWLQAKKYIVIKRAQPQLFAIRKGPRWRFDKKTKVTKKSITVPYTVSAFLAAQANASSGFISRRLAQSFKGGVPPRNTFVLHPELESAIQARIQYVEQLAAFFRQHHLKSGLLKYGWFLV